MNTLMTPAAPTTRQWDAPQRRSPDDTIFDVPCDQTTTILEKPCQPCAVRVPGIGRAIDVKIASKRSEWEAAYQLVAENYRNRGYDPPWGKALRFTPYHALPDTTTYIALSEGQVIGTLSLVLDNVLLGLPMESIYAEEIADLRRAHRRLGEVTSLADNGLSVREFIPIFVGLMSLMAQHFSSQGADTWVITVNPRHSSFYRKIMGFVPLGERRSYPTVQNHPAEAYMLDVPLLQTNAPQMYQQIYGEPLPPQVLQTPRMPAALVRPSAAVRAKPPSSRSTRFSMPWKCAALRGGGCKQDRSGKKSLLETKGWCYPGRSVPSGGRLFLARVTRGGWRHVAAGSQGPDCRSCQALDLPDRRGLFGHPGQPPGRSAAGPHPEGQPAGGLRPGRHLDRSSLHEQRGHGHLHPGTLAATHPKRRRRPTRRSLHRHVQPDDHARRPFRKRGRGRLGSGQPARQCLDHGRRRPTQHTSPRRDSRGRLRPRPARPVPHRRHPGAEQPPGPRGGHDPGHCRFHHHSLRLHHHPTRPGKSIAMGFRRSTVRISWSR